MFVTNPIAIANIYRQDKQSGDAEEYLTRYLDTQPDPLSDSPRDSAARRRFADVYQLLSRVAKETGHGEQSLAHLEKALLYHPESVGVLLDIADEQASRKAWEDARATLQTALRIAQQNPRTLNKLGLVYRALNQTRSAISHFELSLNASPNYFPAANNLAWLLATHPDAEFRDGRRAVKLAERVVRSTRGRPDALDTLAAAHAEAGDFKAAIDVAERAIVASRAVMESNAIEKIETRVQLYKQRKPYREASVD